MRGVHVAVDVRLDGRVDGDDAQTAHHFGAVGDFGRAQHQLVAEEVHVVVNALQAVVGDGQRAGAAELDASLADEADDGVLDDFGVHLEGRDGLLVSQGTQHGVGNVAHARLQRQERRRDDAPFHVGHQEVGHVLPDFVGQRVGGGEGAGLVGPVGFHYADDFLRVYLDVGGADAVAGLVDGDFAAVGRVEGFVHVVQAHGGLAMRGIQFYDDLVGQSADGGGDASGGGQVDFAVRGHFAGLDDGYVYLAHEAVAQFLGHLREVDVVVGNFAVIHSLAKVLVGGVGCAVADGLCFGQDSIARVARRCAREDAHLERTPCGVFRFCYLGQFGRDGLGCSCGCESAQADVVAVLDEAGSFYCRNVVQCHNVFVGLYFSCNGFSGGGSGVPSQYFRVSISLQMMARRASSAECIW